MNEIKHFSAGDSHKYYPHADTASQAVHALRGYDYQCVAAALEWVDISEKSRLYLEVAEDYAVVVDGVLNATQVKDRKLSGVVTLNDSGICKAINSFVHLVKINPGIDIEFHFLTTSAIGEEHKLADRPAGKPGLIYWKDVAAGAAVEPLRKILESDKFDETVREFCQVQNDSDLRNSLIRRIHWDCSNPGKDALSEELENRLVVIGRELYGISFAEARCLTSPVIYQVLQTSIIDDPKRRFLTRADLYQLIDNVNQISIPRSLINPLLQLLPKLINPIGEPNQLSIAGAALNSDLLVDGNTLPHLRQMIPRPNLEIAVSNALSEFGVCILTGGSGVGKSVLARRIAAQLDSRFFILDSRDGDAVKTRVRLNSVLSHIAGLSATMIIFEDLNQLDDPQVRLTFSQVIESVRRRGMVLLITCHCQPSLSELSALGLTQTCVVICPYFEEQETRKLVEIYEGNPEVWGRLAFLAGHSGHPQLTQAFVVGMSMRGWPIDEYSNVVTKGLSSKDMVAVRNSVRRNLKRDMPHDVRSMLYRLSLTVGHFKKSLAWSLATISPVVPLPGECIDQLIGPWIEDSGENRYRVSPLVSGIGREILALDEQRRIHKLIALEYFRLGEVDAHDINSVTMHALNAEWSSGLVKIASTVVLADSRTLGALAEHAVLIRYFRTDRPIYSQDWFASAILRLAQFILATESAQHSDVSEIVNALFREIDALPSDETTDILEALSVIRLVANLGSSKHVDNWVGILIRLMDVMERSEFVRGVVAGLDTSSKSGMSTYFGQMFCVGSFNLKSVKQLETIIDQLDVIDKRNRDLLLTPIDDASSDYSMFINAPCTKERHNEEFDAIDAEKRYARIAEKTLNWGIRSLTLQCWVARSIILNEILNDQEKAISVLDVAVGKFGQDLILSKAKATVYWYQDEHITAFEIYQSIAQLIAEESPEESTFVLRQAAISAGKCGEWSIAKKWFLEAQRVAASLDGETISVITIGLGADAALSKIRAGDTRGALAGLVSSVDALTNVDPDKSIATAYCHRVVRHAVLWVHSHIDNMRGKGGIQVTDLEPGTCSNPNPLPAIRELPLGHIACAWYMLAETEILANLDVGIYSSLSNRLTDGVIPLCEYSLRVNLIQKHTSNLDADGFAQHFTKFIETTVYCSQNMQRLKSTFDIVTPIRESIPTIDNFTSLDPVVEQFAREAVLGFGMYSLMKDQSASIVELEKSLTNHFGKNHPGKSVYDYLNNGLSLTDRDQAVVEIIKRFLQIAQMPLRDFYLAGLYFFVWIDNSVMFRDSLILSLAHWQRSGWERILQQEKFQISDPFVSVPPIVECLEGSENDRSFVAELLIASSYASGVRLSSSYSDYLLAAVNIEQ